MGNEPTTVRLDDICSPCEHKFAELAELIGTNVVHDTFSFAEMHSL